MEEPRQASSQLPTKRQPQLQPRLRKPRFPLCSLPPEIISQIISHALPSNSTFLLSSTKRPPFLPHKLHRREYTFKAYYDWTIGTEHRRDHDILPHHFLGLIYTFNSTITTLTTQIFYSTRHNNTLVFPNVETLTTYISHLQPSTRPLIRNIAVHARGSAIITSTCTRSNISWEHQPSLDIAEAILPLTGLRDLRLWGVGPGVARDVRWQNGAYSCIRRIEDGNAWRTSDMMLIAKICGVEEAWRDEKEGLFSTRQRPGWNEVERQLHLSPSGGGGSTYWDGLADNHDLANDDDCELEVEVEAEAEAESAYYNEGHREGDWEEDGEDDTVLPAALAAIVAATAAATTTTTTTTPSPFQPHLQSQSHFPHGPLHGGRVFHLRHNEADYLGRRVRRARIGGIRIVHPDFFSSPSRSLSAQPRPLEQELYFPSLSSSSSSSSSSTTTSTTTSTSTCPTTSSSSSLAAITKAYHQTLISAQHYRTITLSDPDLLLAASKRHHFTTLRRERTLKESIHYALRSGLRSCSEVRRMERSGRVLKEMELLVVAGRERVEGGESEREGDGQGEGEERTGRKKRRRMIGYEELVREQVREEARRWEENVEDRKVARKRPWEL